MSSGVAVEDLYALAGCDLLIGPPSTFTQWASFYGKVPLYHAWSPDAAPTRDDFAVADLGLISFTQSIPRLCVRCPAGNPAVMRRWSMEEAERGFRPDPS